MSDYISREELKEEIEKCHITSGVTNQGVWNECIDSILRTIDYIPSADVRENIQGKKTPDDDRDKVFHVHGSCWHRVIAKNEQDAKIKFLEKLKQDNVDDLYFKVGFVRYDDTPFEKRAMTSFGESCMIDQGITQGIV